MINFQDLSDQELIDYAFYYGEYIKNFDDSFVQSMQDRVNNGLRLYDSHRKGLIATIIAGKRISGDNELDDEL